MTCVGQHQPPYAGHALIALFVYKPLPANAIEETERMLGVGSSMGSAVGMWSGCHDGAGRERRAERCVLGPRGGRRRHRRWGDRFTGCDCSGEGGASVILVEANWDIGAATRRSAGGMSLWAAGPARRRRPGLDSPDLLFSDLTDWSVVEGNGFPSYRYNDKEVIRAFADESAPTYEWLVKHGVIFVEGAPDTAARVAQATRPFVRITLRPWRGCSSQRAGRSPPSGDRSPRRASVSSVRSRSPLASWASRSC